MKTSISWISTDSRRAGYYAHATPASMSIPRKIAVVYAPQGGVGDVGKFAVAHALRAANVIVKPIAMTSRATTPAKFEFQVDVEPRKHREAMQAIFEEVTPAGVVVEDASATEKLQAELDGVNACIVCIANRQPGRRYPELRSRWASSGIKVIEQAMQAAGVKRLVLVNSMGVYEDYLPSSSFWSFGWGWLMRTKGLKQDLQGMEDYVTASNLDYLIVKVAGLVPYAQPTGEWQLLTASGQPTPGMLNLSKSDAAQFLVNEAVAPSFHRRIVSIGGKGKGHKA